MYIFVPLYPKYDVILYYQTIIATKKPQSMSNSFDYQIEDQCLRFIRDDSSQNQSDLFKNNQEIVKIQEEEIQIDIENNKNQNHVKRKRNQNNDASGKTASKKKIFYRDKMISLISEEEMKNRVEYNYGDYSQSARGKSPISRDEQLKRNRESAKHSRQRRKQYVQTLELKNQENQKKIQQLTIKLREAELERDRLKQDNRSYMKTFMTTKNQAYQNLSEILYKSGKRSTDKLSEELQMLIARYGAAGSERIAATDYYMKQIIEILLADIHKYIVDCVVNDSGLFGLGEWSKLDDQICGILKINKEFRVKLARNYKVQMMEQFETFKAVAQKFYDAYRAVQNQARIIQKIFERISVQFNDACIAQLILWLQQNKFSKELKRIRADWARGVQQPQEPTGKARKITPYEAMERF